MGERLGQYFLKNKSAIPKIIASLELAPDDTIIEIGPGEGALTFELVRECSELDIGCEILAVKRPRANKLKIKLIVRNHRGTHLKFCNPYLEHPDLNINLNSSATFLLHHRPATRILSDEKSSKLSVLMVQGSRGKNLL